MPTKATSTGARDELAADAVGDRGGVVLDVEQVMARDAGLRNQPFAKVFAKAGGMIGGEADILVEVKHLDARPLDARRRRQRVEEVELRRAGRGDDPRAAPFRDGGAERSRRLRRRRPAQRRPVDVGLDRQHG